MKNNKLRNILLIAGTAVTAILAVVVILVSTTLQQRGNEPVAPNVPSSKPAAAVPESCTTSFTVAEPEKPKALCAQKMAFIDVSTNTPGNYDLKGLNTMPADSAVYPGTTFVYHLKGVPINSGNAPEVSWQDVLDANLEFVDASEDCTPTTSTSTGKTTVSCKQGNPHNEADYSVSIRVKVKSTATAGVLNNTASVLTDGVVTNTCAFKLNIVPPTALTCAKKIFSDEKNVQSPFLKLGESGYPEIASGGTVKPGQTLLFSPKLKNPSTSKLSNLTVKDVLDTNLTYLDGDSNCTYTASNRTVTCTGVMVAAETDALANATFRVKVADTAAQDTVIPNTYTVTGTNVNTATCGTSVKVVPPTTTTPTPTPTPGTGFWALKYNDVNGDGQKQDSEKGLSWDFEWDLNGDNNWRAYVTYDTDGGRGGTVSNLKGGDKVRIREKGKDGWSSTTPNQFELTLKSNEIVKAEFGNRQKTTLGCNNSCSSTSDCASGLTCSNGTCRNNSCSAKTNCVCDVTGTSTPAPAASATPAPTALPEAGSTAETFGVVAVGIVITVLGVIGLFAL